MIGQLMGALLKYVFMSFSVAAYDERDYNSYQHEFSTGEESSDRVYSICCALKQVSRYRMHPLSR